MSFAFFRTEIKGLVSCNCSFSLHTTNFLKDVYRLKNPIYGNYSITLWRVRRHLWKVRCSKGQELPCFRGKFTTIFTNVLQIFRLTQTNNLLDVREKEVRSPTWYLLYPIQLCFHVSVPKASINPLNPELNPIC
jgi:hypothetical protein